MTTAEKLDLERLKLFTGKHSEALGEMCVMEVAARLAGEPHSDHPTCVDQCITLFAIGLNDHMPDCERQKLKPFIRKMIGTRTDNIELMNKRALIAADFAVRIAAPFALDAAWLSDEASKLRALSPVVDRAAAVAARAAVCAASAAAGVSSAAAWAASDAAWAASAAAWAASDAAWASSDAADRAAHAAAGAAMWKKITPLALKALSAMIEVKQTE